MVSLIIAIDAENMSPKFLPLIEVWAVKTGEVIDRKIFGDFSMIRMKSWLSAAESLFYHVVHTPHFKAKNIADMAMIIDVLETTYEKHPDVVILGTGDADFTPLVENLKGKGIRVIGVGASESSSHFRSACDLFIGPQDLNTEVPSKVPRGALPRTVSSALLRIGNGVLKFRRCNEWVPVSEIESIVVRNSVILDCGQLGINNIGEMMELHRFFDVRYEGDTYFFRKKIN